MFDGNRVTKVEISHRTIVFAVLFVLGLYVTYLVRDILVILFVSFLLMTAVSPLVILIHKTRLPRGMSIVVAYLLVLGVLVGAIAAVVPPLVSQTATLISRIPIPPSIADDLRNINIGLQDLNVIANQLTSVPKILGVIGSAFSALIVTITVGVITFYLLQEKQNLHKHLQWLFGDGKAEAKAQMFVSKIDEKIGGWVRGELTLMFVIGATTYVGLRLLNVDFALPLAILAGILELLPSIGPTIAAIPAVGVALFSGSPIMAIWVLALYLVIQQLENSFIVPVVMNKAVGLNPIVTILLLLTGFRLGGIAGAVLAIPLFLVIKVTMNEFYSSGK